MAFGLRIEGLEQLDALAGRLLEARRNTLGPRTEIAEEMMLRTHDNWVASRAPDGSAWPASARALGFGGQTMLESGKLFASVTYDVSGEDLLLFTDDKRARVHHEGLTIKPKPGKRALAIPLNEAVKDAHREGVSIRDQYPDSFLLVAESGNAFIVRKAADAVGSSYLGSIEFLYLLVDHVDMPERPLLGFGGGDQHMATEVLARHFAAAEGAA
jgi:phage gpG-like protein